MRWFPVVSVFLILLTACSASKSSITLSLSTGTTAPLITRIPTLSIVPRVSPTPQLLPNSEWAGAIINPDGTIKPIIVRLNGVSGTLTIQPHATPQTISGVLFNNNQLSFKVTAESESHFTGSLYDGQISGQVVQDGQTGKFVLLPLLIDNAGGALAEFTGTYQFESGESLYITVSPEYRQGGLDYFWSGLTLTDFGTGIIRGLYPIGKDKFLLGSGRVLGYPFKAQVKFLRDASSKVTGLLWQKRDPVSGDLDEGQNARLLSLQTETVHYTSSDGITLAGLLTFPETTGPHAAIVVLHGSERGTRDDFGRQIMSSFIASQELVALTYDKRGVGDSGGTYQEAASMSNLTLLAQDALAGVNYLKTRPEVDGRPIGLIGYSQAGWIIPLAAAQSQDVTFFINLSGPVVSVGTEELYSSYTNNGDSPASLTSEEISGKLALSSPVGFDPVPVLAKLEQPGLWVWGSQDKSIPVHESMKNLETLIAQGKSNYTFIILPSADHNLQQTTQGLFAEIPYSSGYPENFHNLLANWLEKNVK
jgi:pimeloyl-ACP methyl ester carboxylesterase